MLFLLNDHILKCFFFFLQSLFVEMYVVINPNFVIFYIGIIPFKFSNLSKYHIWKKEHFFVHFVNFHRHIILRFELLLFVLPLQVYDNCRTQTPDCLQIVLISSI